MKQRLRRVSAAVAVLLAAGCAHRSDLAQPQTQDNFGVRMAKMSLWREAMFRFRRAVEINPGDAMAHNNLAVAYEANGDFDNARKEYLEALKLDRTNAYIQKNYSRYVEFLSRNKKRAAPKGTAAAAATPATLPVGAKGGTDVIGGVPERAEGTEKPKPVEPTGGQPSDLPPPAPQPPPAAVPQPTTPPPAPQPVPPVKPPGDAR